MNLNILDDKWRAEMQNEQAKFVLSRFVKNMTIQRIIEEMISDSVRVNRLINRLIGNTGNAGYYADWESQIYLAVYGQWRNNTHER